MGIVISLFVIFLILSVVSAIVGVITGSVLSGIVAYIVAVVKKVKPPFAVCMSPAIAQAVVGACLGSIIAYAIYLSLLISGFESNHEAAVFFSLVVFWCYSVVIGGILGAISGTILGIRRWQRIRRGLSTDARGGRLFTHSFRVGDRVIWHKKTRVGQIIPTQAVVLAVFPKRVKISADELNGGQEWGDRTVSPSSLSYR